MYNTLLFLFLIVFREKKVYGDVILSQNLSIGSDTENDALPIFELPEGLQGSNIPAKKARSSRRGMLFGDGGA